MKIKRHIEDCPRSTSLAKLADELVRTVQCAERRTTEEKYCMYTVDI
jgi:hypothetical protein